MSTTEQSGQGAGAGGGGGWWGFGSTVSAGKWEAEGERGRESGLLSKHEGPSGH